MLFIVSEKKVSKSRESVQINKQKRWLNKNQKEEMIRIKCEMKFILK
jgi:hypothetical protein